MFLDPELNELERPNRGAIGLLSDDGDAADAGFAAPAVGDASETDELEWCGALALRSDAKRRADDDEDEDFDDDLDDEDELDEEDDEEFDDDTDEDFEDDELDEDEDEDLEEFDDEDDDV